MGALSPILRSIAGGYVGFWCPGCNEQHHVGVAPPAALVWGYNGNAEAPTFTPSILVRSGHHVPGHMQGDGCWCSWPDKEEFPDLVCTICHSFVTNGAIQFLGDCTHALTGQTVPLPPYPGDDI